MKEIESAIDKIYRDSKRKPVLLSYIGHELAKMHLALPGGIGLLDFIKNNCLNYLVQQLPDNELVYCIIANSDSDLLIQRRDVVDAEITLDKIYRSTIVAFCYKTQGNQKVYIDRNGPYRYVVSDEDKGDPYVIVENKYRSPGVYVGNLNKVDKEIKDDIFQKILNWAKDNAVPLDCLVKRSGRGLSEKKTKNTNALQRFIAAQPQEILGKVYIPLDIIQILMSHE